MNMKATALTATTVAIASLLPSMGETNVQTANAEQLSNVKNILNDMRNNKRTLKRIIEQHFQEQNSQNKSNENQ